MYELTEQEIELVAHRVSTSVSSKQLQVELIDHCCSRIEELVDANTSFDMALDCALSELSPDGLHIIQEEWNFQHNLKNEPMKITLYLSGFLAAFGILLGFLFKLLHWPGANVILTIGDAMLIVAMFGILIPAMWHRKGMSNSAFVRLVSGAGGGVLFGFGSFFKLMYWPGANILIFVGTFVILFGFLPLFFWELYRKEMRTQI